MVGLFNGRQTHSLVVFLLNKTKVGQKVDIFGYTFDHQQIADAMVRAAIRGVLVRLTLNSDEVEGRSSTREAAPTILDMMRRCEEAGCDHSSIGRLEVLKQQGQLIAPVYASWGRRTSVPTSKKGPLHAKLVVVGPHGRVPRDKDARVVVMGSTNWTVSSEANAELSVALSIGSDGAAGVDHVVRDLRHGAIAVTCPVMQNHVAGRRERDDRPAVLPAPQQSRRNPANCSSAGLIV